MKTTKRLLVVSCIALLSIAPTSQSTWVALNNIKTEIYQVNKSDVTTVAYTITDSTINYYLTIESALEHTTSGTIYVVPNTNPIITRNCEIKNGVTLCIPYDDNGDGTHSDYTNLEHQSNNGFADKDATAVNTNRKNLITIKEGITLKNNGTLDIAGTVGIGKSSQRPSGFTMGSYCEILMKANSKIENNGTINLYGYIKEETKDNGSILENTPTGSIKMPFTIYDFRGGTFSSNAYSKNSMPFSYFDFPNCHVTQVFNYGAKLTGIALLYASSKYYSSELLALATDTDDCLFKMSNGSKVTMKYVPSNFGYTTEDVNNTVTENTANYTKITIDGNLSLASFKINVLFYTFDSSTVECPICYKYQITQNSGKLTIANKMKFLSGSSLTIANGATCSVEAGTTFYEGYTPVMTTGDKNYSPQKMGRAKLVVNGELSINSDFGGLINSESDSGKVITGEYFVDNYVSQEYSEPNWARHIEYAEAYKLIDSKPSTFRLENGQTYTLGKNLNYWNESSNTDLTSFTLDNPSGTSSSKATKTYTVSALYNYTGVSYSSSNVTYNWKVYSSTSESGTYTLIENPDSSMLTINNNVATFTTPAATSASVYYKLTCTISFERVDQTTSNLSLTSGIYEAYYYDSSGSCILPTARVLMADGSYKEAQLIANGDKVISFNHETGEFETNVIIVNAHENEEAKDCNVLHLVFDNGNTTNLVYKHGYFDLTLNKYVYISINNYSKYIGHEFVYVDSNCNRSKVKLISGEVKRLHTKVVSPVTANHLNLIADNMLSLSSSMDGLFNIFEYNPNTLAFDKDKMQKDIDKYGLLDYEVFKNYFPKEIYDLLPCKYLGVSIGKGLITWDIIESYINRWRKQLLENIK